MEFLGYLLIAIIVMVHGFFRKREKPTYHYKITQNRPSIPSNVRRYVFERDNYSCQYCGSQDMLEVDHIYPWSLGGADDILNYQTLCRTCNRRKGNKII